MRRDFIVDGFIYSDTVLGGNDATYKIISMIESLHRNDVHYVILGGPIISIFNIIDGKWIYEKTGLPVIAISFRRTSGIINSIHGPANEKKIENYLRLEERKQVTLRTGKDVFVRSWGIDFDEVPDLLNSFLIQGAKPEPLRLATLAARACRNYVTSITTNEIQKF